MRVAILGNGVAGVTAALELRRRRPDCAITVVSGESEHFYSRPALMYVFLGHMRFEHTKPFEDRVWRERRIDLVRAWVTRIDLDRKRLELDAASGLDPIPWDELVIATGSRSNRFGWPGQDLAGVQGLVSLQDLELLERNVAGVARAVIVGGGLIGIELAEMLRSRGIGVTFLVREPTYWGTILPAEESAVVNRVIRSHGIDLRLSTQLREIVGDDAGRARAVVTDAGERIDCQLVGLTAGVSPNLALLAGTGIETARGVLVDRSFATNVPHVHAVGDCAEIRLGDGTSRVEQLWYTAKAHGEVLGRVLAGEAATYERGIEFNSAKFFDLEYQTYGLVRRGVPREESVYWEAPDARRALRIVHAEGAVIGFDSLGIRIRHRVCERWIRERRSLDHVLENLAEASFDPELSGRAVERAARTWRARTA